jgi:regulator of nucleoside diphosphate kinase
VGKKPKIVITSLDLKRLEDLLDSLPFDAFPGKEDLEDELARAEVVDSKSIPPTVVTMNSTVRFKVISTNNEYLLTLVYPKDIKPDGSTISILAPVGSALIGLSQGDLLADQVTLKPPVSHK